MLKRLRKLLCKFTGKDLIFLVSVYMASLIFHYSIEYNVGVLRGLLYIYGYAIFYVFCLEFYNGKDKND